MSKPLPDQAFYSSGLHRPQTAEHGLALQGLFDLTERLLWEQKQTNKMLWVSLNAAQREEFRRLD
jgi:hypothetical protein